MAAFFRFFLSLLLFSLSRPFSRHLGPEATNHLGCHIPVGIVWSGEAGAYPLPFTLWKKSTDRSLSLVFKASGKKKQVVQSFTLSQWSAIVGIIQNVGGRVDSDWPLGGFFLDTFSFPPWPKWSREDYSLSLLLRRKWMLTMDGERVDSSGFSGSHHQKRSPLFSSVPRLRLSDPAAGGLLFGRERPPAARKVGFCLYLGPGSRGTGPMRGRGSREGGQRRGRPRARGPRGGLEKKQ